MSANPLSAERSSQLGARRMRNRRRARIAFVVLSLLLAGGTIYELNQPTVRISQVLVYGADQSFADFATAAMEGSYLGLVPRDSTFFFPASRIRSDIIAAHPDIAAVSLFRSGFTGLTIKVNDRVPVARWCGASPDTRFNLGTSTRLNLVENCYVFDASGFIFAAYATSTETINSFALYAPLQGDTLEPLRATLAQAEMLPAVFDLARKFTALGSPAVRVVLLDDEVSDYLASGTRVTYVLGNEENAFTALTSARESLNLADGSLEYVDLRFDGRVYLKRR